ncbi:MAG TPA: ribosome maturation factor RimM [Longimicrobium sp.]|nr:ribosome maturation factor RimM [Longimicrobium sp.]
MTDSSPEYLIVGTIQKPHGIKGELFVRLETDRPDAVFAAGRALMLGDGQGRPSDAVLTVERARAFKGGMLVKVAGQGARTPELDELRGRTLLIPRDQAAPPEEDEVFYHDLLGMKVVTAAEGEVGTIDDVYDAPAGPMLSVRRQGAKELLIPFARQMVRRVDVGEKVLELDLPAGLLEL